MPTATLTPAQAAATALLESKALSAESGKSRPVVVGKTTIYASEGEYYRRVADADCRYFRLYEVDEAGKVVLCFSAHHYAVSQHTRVFSPNFTVEAAELAALFDEYTEEGVFSYLQDLPSFTRLR